MKVYATVRTLINHTIGLLPLTQDADLHTFAYKHIVSSLKNVRL